jgi:chromosome segregation ATPase
MNSSLPCDTTMQCCKCNNLESELDKIKAEKLDLEHMTSALRAKLQQNKDELEREVQKRVDLEQRFTEEAKRTTDQIDELITKSSNDDARLGELNRRFELYSRETSAMIENFTTSREILTSQLMELRQENDYLLGKYLTKSRDLQSADISLPQSVEELQFHCLKLYEKLILSTMAKERLEETLMQTQTAAPVAPNTATPTSSS